MAKESIDWEAGREHWAFQPVRQVEPPSVKQKSWVKQEPDRFLLAGMEKAGLKPGEDADRFTLIRRVTLDLTGLPPTLEEVRSFVHDPDSDDQALARVVDRLLASDQFGERWGRHWLDVVRYADSVGRTRNVPFPYAWRYRNYVIDAFNRDKPYNRFLAEQVAGDLLPAKNESQRDEGVVATGFLALGSMDLNERDREQFRLDQVDDQVDTVGRSILALTTGCARCHDHKFDPISQQDYYALAGIFWSTDTLSGQSNRRGGNQNYFDDKLLTRLGSGDDQAARAAEAAAAKRRQVSKAELTAQRKRVETLARKTRTGTQAQKAEARKQLAAAKKRLASLQRQAKSKQKRGGARVDMNAPLAMSVSDGSIEDLEFRLRGEPDLKGDPVPRGLPGVFFASQHPHSLDSEQSGRLELARWLVDPEHPLTARVMVNRVWSHLFGRGLVATVDNFGITGQAPTHPELLDYLAHRFVEEGWSVKSLVRTLALSHAYRLSSSPTDEHLQRDESNQLYARMELRRMEAEVIRDSLLAAGGQLKLSRPSGASFDQASAAGLANGGRTSNLGQLFREPVRSVYLPVFRSKLPGMFTTFDFAEPDQVTGRRDVTTVAPQALFFLNNQFVVEISERAAERVLAEELGDQDARIQFAYAYTLCRYPTGEELARSRQFLRSGSQERKESWSALMQALYSSAEFRYIR